jgi:hypothetical protein
MAGTAQGWEGAVPVSAEETGDGADLWLVRAEGLVDVWEGTDEEGDCAGWVTGKGSAQEPISGAQLRNFGGFDSVAGFDSDSAHFLAKSLELRVRARFRSEFGVEPLRVYWIRTEFGAGWSDD